MVDPGPMIQCHEFRSRITDQDQINLLVFPLPAASPPFSEHLPHRSPTRIDGSQNSGTWKTTVIWLWPSPCLCNISFIVFPLKSSGLTQKFSAKNWEACNTWTWTTQCFFLHNQWCERPVCSPSESPRGGEGNRSMECGSSLPPFSLYPKLPRSEVEFCVEEDSWDWN